MPQAYPTGLDVQVYLTGAGILPNPLDDSVLSFLELDSAAATGRADFERETGRTFLAQSGTRRFDTLEGRNALLLLRADLCALTSLKVNGVLKALDVDFWFGPENADAKGEPWEWIEFANPFWGVSKRAIEIVGLWGYAEEIPDNAWQAMLEKACLSCYPQLAAARTKGVMRRKEGDVEVEYARSAGTGPYVEERKAWGEFYAARVGDYKRVLVGV